MISGPSGAGKGSIATGLRKRVEKLWLSRSWTTRPPRRGEGPEAYTFVDRATFEAKAAAGGFLEWKAHFDHLYGTPLPDPPPEHDVLLEIDVYGAADVKRQRADAVLILVLPPSRAEQERRLRARGDAAATIASRLARADEEERVGREIADHIVVNDDLGRATTEVVGIVEAHRSPSPEL
ncbi:MAG TPA: guanylate kinase [Acidimicrobiia bacterium]|nr:guanylate kinase [Acidimicrobiia bacterium]